MSALPHRGDVLELELVAGSGALGSRPVLVLSVRSYHAASGLALVVPILNPGPGFTHTGWTFPIDGPGTGVVGVVLADQVRSIDFRARPWRRLGVAPAQLVEPVLDAVRALLE